MTTLFLPDESATLKLGAELATACPIEQHCIIYLEGELGAGKTTLTRGFVQSLGHKGNVKSPTYTLVEHYSLDTRDIYHFDLYRISDPGELEFLGLDDFFSGNSICLLEWAKKGEDYLPWPDLEIQMNYENIARHAKLNAYSALGEQMCNHLKANKLHTTGL